MVEINLKSGKLEVNENSGRQKLKLFNLLAPLMAVTAGITIQIIISYFLFFIIPIINLVIPLNSISASLLIMLLSQIFGSIIIYFIFLRFFHIQKDFSNPIKGSNLSCTISLVFIGYSLFTLISLVLTIVFTLLNLSPQTGYSSILPETQHLTDTFTIILYFAAPTLGAGTFEELVYRRMAIPLLEKHGLSSYSAVLTSALFFSISHFPNDLLNGNFSGGIIHCIIVFIIGIMVGIMYIFSRKIIYSMIIHATFNFLSFAGYLVILINNPVILIINSFLGYTLIILGAGLLIYFIIQFVRKPNWTWRMKLGEKSKYNIKLSILGFIVIGTISLTILTLIQFLFPYLISIGITIEKGLLIIISLFIASTIIMLWIGNRKNLINFQ